MLFVFSLYSSSVQAQIKRIQKTVTFKENVNAPLTAKETVKLKEMYADKFKEYVINRPEHLKYLKHLLRNRIEIVNNPELIKHTEKYKTLSEVGLFDNYNKDLILDQQYNPETFNVLKYRVRIHGNGSSIYRIDNTNYFVIIKSQHQ